MENEIPICEDCGKPMELAQAIGYFCNYDDCPYNKLSLPERMELGLSRFFKGFDKPEKPTKSPIMCFSSSIPCTMENCPGHGPNNPDTRTILNLDKLKNLLETNQEPAHYCSKAGGIVKWAKNMCSSAHEDQIPERIWFWYDPEDNGLPTFSVKGPSTHYNSTVFIKT